MHLPRQRIALVMSRVGTRVILRIAYRPGAKMRLPPRDKTRRHRVGG